MESIIILNNDNKKDNNHDNLQKTHYLNYFETILYDIYDKKIGSFTICEEQLEVIDYSVKINKENKVKKKIIYQYQGTNHENIKIYAELKTNNSLNSAFNNPNLNHTIKNHEKNKKLVILYNYKHRKINKKLVFIDYACSFIYNYNDQNLLYSFSKKKYQYDNQIQTFFICTGGSSFSKTIFLSFGKHWVDYYLIRFIFQKIIIQQKVFYLYKHQILSINNNSQEHSIIPQVEYYPYHEINNMNNLTIINNLHSSIYKFNYDDKIYYFDRYTLHNISHLFQKKQTFIINNESFEFMMDTFSEIIFECETSLSSLSIKKKGNFLHIFPSNELSKEHKLSSLINQNKETIYFYKDNTYRLNETLTKGYFFVHEDWKSVCTLDEEIIYKNKEKGTYQKINEHTLIIKWEKWGENIFHQYQGIYYSDKLFYPIYINYHFLLFLESQNCIVNHQYQLQFQSYYPSNKKEISNKIILRNLNKEEIEYFIQKEIQKDKDIYIVYNSSQYYYPFIFLINNQLHTFYYYENQLFQNTQLCNYNDDTAYPFDIHQPLGTLDFLFIDHDKNKINGETFINYQIKINLYHKQSPSLFFPYNISHNYCLSFQNIFIPVPNQFYIYIIHTSLISNKKKPIIDNENDNNNNPIPYFISKFSKNNLSSTLINEESSINYLEIHHSKTLLLSYATKLIECIQYQDLPIYLEKNIYTSLISDNFNIKYCLLEKKWNNHVLNQLTKWNEIFKEEINDNSTNNLNISVPKNIEYLSTIYLYLTKKIQVYSKETFQKHYLAPKLKYYADSCSMNSFLSSSNQISTICYYQILQYPSIINFNYQNIFLFILDFDYLDDIIQDQPNLFYEYLQKISLFLEKQELNEKHEQVHKQEKKERTPEQKQQQFLLLFICINYQSSSNYSKQIDLFIKNLSMYYPQLFYLTTTKSISTTCLLYDIKHLLQNFNIYNYKSLFIIQSFFEQVEDNTDIKLNNIMEQDQDSKKNYQPYPISSLKENTFYIIKQELLFPLINYQMVSYIKNKYDFVYLILIWFLKHRSIWNKLENENIIMNINLNKFLKIFSNEKKE